MVKLIRINPLFFVMVIITWLSGGAVEFLIMFLTLIIHELIHLFFMIKSKIAVSKISIEPFGISITAKNININDRNNPWIYLSAPLFNLALGCIIFTLSEKSYYVNYFILTNLSLGLFNLIPAIPFDGGRALNTILMKKNGETGGLSNKISIITAVILILLGIYLVYIIQFNLSLVIIGIFLLYNSVTAEKSLIIEKNIRHYSTLEERGILKESIPINYLAAPKNYSAHKLIKKFKPENYYIIKVIDNGAVTKTLTETQIIKKILSESKELKVCEI